MGLEAEIWPSRLGPLPKRANSRPGRADSRPEGADFRPERVNFRPKSADFKPERAWGNGRRDERMYGSPPVFYRILSPLVPLPCFLSLYFTIMQSRATGIADHILPLGDLFFFCDS